MSSMTEKALMIGNLRQEAINAFFEKMGEETDIQSLIHETADSFVPAHYSTLVEIATAPYGECTANFFLLASVESGLLGKEITAADVLNRAVYEFLCTEIGEEITRRRETAEQEISDAGYNGFSNGTFWYCTTHAIDEVLDGKWEDLLAFCTGKTTEMPPKLVEAWHDDSFQYVTDPSTMKDGLHCEHVEDGEECGAEILAADDDFEGEEEEAENE